MIYSVYLELKQMALEEEVTTNYVAEYLKIPPKVARCLVKDWHEQAEKNEEIERVLEKERNMIDYLVKYHLSSNTYTFERFVEHGRLYALDKTKEDGHMVNGIPWSFKFNGCAVTHENDECYLIQTEMGFEKFTPNDLLFIKANGYLSIIKNSII